MPASILIIDDYEDNRELLRVMLEQAGYVVSEARGGREGIEMARNEPPDVALVDLSMPGLDGWAVLDELRADERTQGILCAAVSAYADGARMRALTHGFDAYLTKPFRRNELLETVERLLVEPRTQKQETESSAREEVS
ncbi:MAG TPA: response regulator [Pyrinomonadaceae bacterium]|jgi:CheY-like chemotaxis protein|nr:response regulator [Pyrinomonadaceae bacterium]